MVAVKVSPAKEGRPVVLQRLSGTSWVKAGKTKLTKQGLAEFSVATTSAARRSSTARPR